MTILSIIATPSFFVIRGYLNGVSLRKEFNEHRENTRSEISKIKDEIKNVMELKQYIINISTDIEWMKKAMEKQDSSLQRLEDRVRNNTTNKQ